MTMNRDVKSAEVPPYKLDCQLQVAGPCYLVQALSLAGAEAEAGEIGKDYHHETSN